MGSESIPPDELDAETLRDQLRVAERKLALAEAHLAISRIGRVPEASGPGDVDTGTVDAALDVLFHTAAVAMVLLSTDGTILRANAAAADLWGISVSELPGRRTVELTSPEDVEDSERRLGQADRGHFLLKTYVHADGTSVPCLALGWPLVDDDGAVVCLIGVAVPLRHVASAPSMLDVVLRAAGRAADDHLTRDPAG